MNRWWLVVAGFAVLLMIHVVLTVRQIDRLELDAGRLAAAGNAGGDGESAQPAANLEFRAGAADFDDWLDRPLFWPDRRPVETSEPQGPPPQRASLGNVRLAGIVGTREDPVALLEYEGTSMRIRRGDSVTPGWKLEEILSESVVIRSDDGQSTTLRLFEAIGVPPARALSRRQGQGVDVDQGRRRFPVAQPVDEPPVGASSGSVSEEEMAKRPEARKRASARPRGTDSSASEEFDNEDREKDANGNSASAVPSPQTQESGRED